RCGSRDAAQRVRPAVQATEHLLQDGIAATAEQNPVEAIQYFLAGEAAAVQFLDDGRQFVDLLRGRSLDEQAHRERLQLSADLVNLFDLFRGRNCHPQTPARRLL